LPVIGLHPNRPLNLALIPTTRARLKWRAFLFWPHAQMVSTFSQDFDPMAIPDPPQPEPLEIRSGDTVKWERACNDYPPSDGFSLSYAFVSRAASYQVNGSMVGAGSQNYEIAIPAATTAGWAPGWYRWQAYINDSATPPNRFMIGEGKVEVLPNLQTQTAGFDDREPDEIILDQINAMILAKSSQDVESYRIFERELKLYTWTDVLRAKSIYEDRVRALRIRRGESVPKRTIGVSFNHGY
jgi:hypothetical protein